MPKRTNDFQELVALIQRALVPEGATITESAMVETSDGRTAREIDILIDSAVGPYRIRVAVEAKKQFRKMDEVAFDSIVGKYLHEGGVHVNKIVVVAHKGFTEGVITRARVLKIDLIKLSEANSVDWSRLRPPHSCLQAAVELIAIEYDDAVRNQFGGNVPDEAQIVCSCGQHYGPPRNYARYVFSNMIVQQKREEVLDADRQVMETGEEKKLKIAIKPAEPHQVFLTCGNVRAAIQEFAFKVRLFVPPSRFSHLKMALAPHVCKVRFIPEILGVDQAELLDNAKVSCSCCGRDHGTVRKWAHYLALTSYLAQNPGAQKALQDGLKRSPNGEAHLIACWPVPSRFRIQVGGQTYAPQTVEIDIHAVTATGEMSHAQYEMCNSDGTTSRLDSFEAVVAGKRLRIVMPDGTASKKIVLRIDNVQDGDPKKNNSAGAQRPERVDEDAT